MLEKLICLQHGVAFTSCVETQTQIAGSVVFTMENMLFRRVLVRVLVALLKEESLFLSRKQQAPEQAPGAKAQ